MTADAADPLHERDFHAWTQEQAARLRAAAARRVNADLDWENIAEELEGMGGSLRQEMESRLTTILEHLLKLAFSTLAEPQRQWRNTVRTQRRSLAKLLRRNPSLRPRLEPAVRDCYEDALFRLEPGRIELGMEHLPGECPFDPDEQILDEEWYPEPAFR